MSDANGDTADGQARPTLRTIASISGLAVPTVSRALGDAPDISAATKEKVRRIAAEIGYVPNRAGVRLRTGRTNVISLVLETERDVMNMTARLIGAVARGLDGTSYHLIMTPEMRGQDPMKAIRYIVETRSADAIVLNRIQPRDPRVAYLREQGFPFATHGRTEWAADHAYFDFDNELFGRTAVETLAARGRKHLLMLTPPKDQSYALDMTRGAAAAAEEQGVDLFVVDTVSSDSARSKLSAGMNALLRERPETDALISATPTATMIATALFEDNGHAIGADVDVFSKETVSLLKLFRPAILTLQEDVEKAGLFLARAAMHEVDRKEGEAHLQMLDVPPEGR